MAMYSTLMSRFFRADGSQQALLHAEMVFLAIFLIRFVLVVFGFSFAGITRFMELLSLLFGKGKFFLLTSGVAIVVCRTSWRSFLHPFLAAAVPI